MCRRLLLILLTLLFSSCASGPQINTRPELTLEQLVHQAKVAIAKRDYNSAADLYSAATLRKPDNLDLQLRRGELLQAAKRWEEAAEGYRDALKTVPPDTKSRHQLNLQLGFLAALKLDHLTEAEAQRDLIPVSEIVDHLDLSATIFIAKNRPHEALRLLHRVAKKVQQPGLAARIDFHSALAYQQLGEEKNTYRALFQAVNNSQHLGLAKQIEEFWYSLEDRNRPSPPPR